MDNACFFFLYKITVFSSKGKFINSATSNSHFYYSIIYSTKNNLCISFHRLYRDMPQYLLCLRFNGIILCMMPFLMIILFCAIFIHSHKGFYTIGFGCIFDRESVSLHNCFIILDMCLFELLWHCKRVI